MDKNRYKQIWNTQLENLEGILGNSISEYFTKMGTKFCIRKRIEK